MPARLRPWADAAHAGNPRAAQGYCAQHDALAYLTYDAGLEVMAVIQESEDTQPSAARLIALAKQIRQEKPVLIAVEPQYSDKPAQALSRETACPRLCLIPWLPDRPMPRWITMKPSCPPIAEPLSSILIRAEDSSPAVLFEHVSVCRNQKHILEDVCACVPRGGSTVCGPQRRGQDDVAALPDRRGKLHRKHPLLQPGQARREAAFGICAATAAFGSQPAAAGQRIPGLGPPAQPPLAGPAPGQSGRAPGACWSL